MVDGPVTLAAAGAPPRVGHACPCVLCACAVVLQGDSKAGRLGFVAGLIPQEKLNGFERLLFRCVRVCTGGGGG
jgi:hypothetical protein